MSSAEALTTNRSILTVVISINTRQVATVVQTLERIVAEGKRDEHVPRESSGRSFY